VGLCHRKPIDKHPKSFEIVKPGSAAMWLLEPVFLLFLCSRVFLENKEQSVE
jgi:hypothetical protein